MKLLDYFCSTGNRITAATVGLLTGVGIGMLSRWEYGIICGAGIAILVSIVYPLAVYLKELPLERLRSGLTGPFHFDEQVLFRSPRGAFSGYFLLNDSSLFLLTRERRHGICMELKRENVRSVRMDDETTLRIFLNETQYICILCAVAEEIFDFLGRNGWNIVKNG